MEKSHVKKQDKVQTAKKTLTGSNSQPLQKVVTVSSGKGGVGKTFFSTSLAFTLARLGRTVTVVDLDITGANVHTSLGMNPSYISMRQFFEGTKNLKDLVIQSKIPRLNYIQGFWDTWMPSDFSAEQITKLIAAISTLESDFVVIDMGPGASDSHLQIIKSAHENFLVTSPEPSSIEKSYRFVEAYMCDSLRSNVCEKTFGNMISILKNYRQKTMDKPFSFRNYLSEENGFTFDVQKKLNSQPLSLVVNSARTNEQQHLGQSMRSVCKKYYGIDIRCAGVLSFDNAVWQSAEQREHVFISHPYTPLAGQFFNVCKQLIENSELSAVA